MVILKPKHRWADTTSSVPAITAIVYICAVWQTLSSLATYWRICTTQKLDSYWLLGSEHTPASCGQVMIITYCHRCKQAGVFWSTSRIFCYFGDAQTRQIEARATVSNFIVLDGCTILYCIYLCSLWSLEVPLGYNNHLSSRLKATKWIDLKISANSHDMCHEGQRMKESSGNCSCLEREIVTIPVAEPITTFAQPTVPAYTLDVLHRAGPITTKQNKNKTMHILKDTAWCIHRGSNEPDKHTLWSYKYISELWFFVGAWSTTKKVPCSNQSARTHSEHTSSQDMKIKSIN